jgi:hypothetical protein
MLKVVSFRKFCKLSATFKFPKHKDYFTQDYYNEKSDTEDEPYGKQEITEDGLMTTYRRKHSQSAKDVVFHDYKVDQDNTIKKMAHFFDGLKPEGIKEHSKLYVEKNLMGKTYNPDERMKQTQIDKEYLNFDKYEKNTITT